MRAGAPLSSHSSKTYFVVEAAGRDLACTDALTAELKAVVGPPSVVRGDTSTVLAQSPNCDGRLVFVVPGGKALVMRQGMSPHQEQLRAAVQQRGAAYLGICAGAFLGAERLEVKLSPRNSAALEVTMLGLAAGLRAIGPAFGETSGEAPPRDAVLAAGANTLPVRWIQGPWLKPPSAGADTEVVARYRELPGEPAAVTASLGGRVVLSGVHPELPLEHETHEMQFGAPRLPEEPHRPPLNLESSPGLEPEFPGLRVK